MLSWALRKTPDLVRERAKPGSNVKKWDKIVTRVYVLLVIALFITAARDAAHSLNSAVPVALQGLGLAGLMATSGVVWWCMATNPFLSSCVCIQADRGHAVIKGGPYRHIRHPMYASIIPMMFSTALLLGSWRALIPAGLIAVLFVIRTALEDHTLSNEPPGYAEYKVEVRYPLLPGIW
jgi:protein-S-isoprenylcysteine O-methyltransferase Ste14